MDLTACGRLGSLAAAEVISHMGPRPAVAYVDFLKKIAA
jgi:sugar/nucleoside kinase (ribokinase family)